MKIISRFKDYYDTVNNQLFLDDTLYKRHPIDCGFIKDYCVMMHIFRSDYNVSRFGFIAFCGTIYPFVSFKKDTYGAKHFFEVDKADDYYNKLRDQQTRFKSSFSINFIFNEILNKFNGDINTKYGSPIVVGLYHRNKDLNDYGYSLVKDAPLGGDYKELFSQEHSNFSKFSNFNFEQVVDPYSAAQKLDQWYSNFASPYPEMIEVSDKVKATKYGHDGKYSFRTAPKK